VIQIQVDQSGKAAGSPGVAREDLDLATPVALTVVGGVGVVQYLWEIVYKPPNEALTAESAAVLATPGSASTNITPDNRGTYLINLQVDQGAGLGARPEDRARITFYAGPSLNADPTLLPRRRLAAFETLEHNVPDTVQVGGNTDGWAREWEKWFRVIERLDATISTDRFVAASAADTNPGTLAQKLQGEVGIGVDTYDTGGSDFVFKMVNFAAASARYWFFSDATADANPGSTTMRLNNSSQGSATFIYANINMGQAGNMEALLLALKIDDRLFLQQVTSDQPSGSTIPSYKLVRVTGPVEDAGAYVKIPIAVEVNGIDFEDNAQISVAFHGVSDRIRVNTSDTIGSFLEDKVLAGPGAQTTTEDPGGGSFLVRRIQSLSAGFAMTWRYDSSTTIADPGGGDFRLNDVLATATQMAISATKFGNGTGLQDVITRLTRGTILRIQQIRSDTDGSEFSRYLLCKLTTNANDNGTWLQWGIERLDSSTDFEDGEACSFAIIEVPVPEGYAVPDQQQALYWSSNAQKWQTTAPISGSEQYLLRFVGGSSTGFSQSFTNFSTLAFREEFDGGDRSGSSVMSFIQGNNQRVTLQGNWTISSWAFPNVGNYRLRVLQGVPGGFTITFPSNTKAASGAIDMSGALLSQTIFDIYFDGTDAHLRSIPNTAGAAPLTTTLV